jgi:hypothetical protein
MQNMTATSRKLRSGSRMKIFSPLGGASVVAKSNFREILENGKIYAKHVSRPLIARGSGVRTEIFSPLNVAYVAAESNFRELLERGKIYAKHEKTLKGSRVGLANGNIFSTGAPP